MQKKISNKMLAIIVVTLVTLCIWVYFFLIHMPIDFEHYAMKNDKKDMTLSYVVMLDGHYKVPMGSKQSGSIKVAMEEGLIKTRNISVHFSMLPAEIVRVQASGGYYYDLWEDVEQTTDLKITYAGKRTILDQKTQCFNIKGYSQNTTIVHCYNKHGALLYQIVNTEFGSAHLVASSFRLN